MYLPTRSLAKSTPDPIIAVSFAVYAISLAIVAGRPSKVTPVKGLGLKPPSGTLRYLEERSYVIKVCY